MRPQDVAPRGTAKRWNPDAAQRLRRGLAVTLQQMNDDAHGGDPVPVVGATGQISQKPCGFQNPCTSIVGLLPVGVAATLTPGALVSPTKPNFE
jgi:hypothetical protein